MSEKKQIDFLKDPPDFSMVGAQKLVEVYRISGRYIEALRLLQCMKEKTIFDMEFYANIRFLQEEFIPNLDRQCEEIRALLRAGI